jgi:hypothetical protein
VYAQIPPGEPLDHDAWVAAVQAGRCFVTSYPLIPEFRVGEAMAGDTLDTSEEVVDLPVHVRALCALGLQRVSILAEGAPIWTANFTGQIPPVFDVDTTVTVTVPTPTWLCVSLEGFTFHPHAVHGSTRAMTNAVHVTRDGTPVVRTAPAGRWMDKLDLLRQLALNRGNWANLADRDTVLARIQRSKDFYAPAFVLPPNPFFLVFPSFGDTVRSGELSFDWQDANDPEIGDKLRYILWVSSDSTLAHPFSYAVEESFFGNIPLMPGREYWWAVDAQDRNGNTTRAGPPVSRFFLRDATTGVEAPTPVVLEPVRPRGVPNPSEGPVRLLGLVGPIEIFDVAGRRVARDGAGIMRLGNDLFWDGTAQGRPAPPGLYWARERGARTSIRLIRFP